MSALRTELERGKGELSTLTETLALVQRQKAEVELGRYVRRKTLPAACLAVFLALGHKFMR